MKKIYILVWGIVRLVSAFLLIVGAYTDYQSNNGSFQGVL